MMSLPKKVFAFFASYGLACALFLLLLILTFLGTVEQIELGLYTAQQKFFASLVLVHELFGVVPVVLPGAYLLLVLLMINLVCGGIIRIRKGWSQIGVLTAHLGIVLLLVGGFVKFKFAEDGHMTLFEGEQSNEFESYYHWEIAIAEARPSGPVTEYLIPDSAFNKLTPGQTVTFVRDELPFDITARRPVANAVPRPAPPGLAPTVPVVDGYYLEGRPRAQQAEQNIPGLHVSLTDKTTGDTREAILWGASRLPLAIEAGGSVWTVDLRKRRYLIPFTIALTKFTRELHPRTNIPKVFMSEVTKIEHGVPQQFKISMNEPLRHRGYTLFQASWGPPDAKPGDPLFSTFAVVNDPAEPIPLYASLVVTLGLLIHFSIRLSRYLRTQSAQAAASKVSS